MSQHLRLTTINFYEFENSVIFRFLQIYSEKILGTAAY